MITHRQLITDTADLHDMTLEALTENGLAAMGDLLDRIEAKLRGAVAAMPATVPA